MKIINKFQFALAFYKVKMFKNFTSLSDLLDYESSSLFTSDCGLPSCKNSTQENDNDANQQILNVPYTIIEAIVAVVAVVGNALVIIAFCRERKLRRKTNYYIMSLALADFLVGCLGIPIAIMVRLS